MWIKTSSALISGIVSFAFGLTLGVLFAPSAGERTRRRLRHAGGELAYRATDVKESAADLVDRARCCVA